MVRLCGPAALLIAGTLSAGACRDHSKPSSAPADASSAASHGTCPVSSPPTGPRGERFAWLSSGIRRSLAALEGHADPTTRDLMNAALAALVLDRDGAAAEARISRVFATQAEDGTFPWNERSRDAVDKNALEFAAQSLGPILLRYGPCLRPELAASLVPHVRAAIAALERDAPRVGVTYTNIWLMNAESLTLLGEAVGDAEAEARGIAELEAWTKLTKEHGIFEFDSPTYYAADLDSLVLAEHFATAPRARELAHRALNLLWTDVAANWFVPRESLVGPHSRDYDFLRGEGGIDVFTAVAGWRALPKPEALNLEKVALWRARRRVGTSRPSRCRSSRTRARRAS